MSSDTKPTAALVPKLRFPGFSAPWTYEPIAKVLKEHKLKNTAGRAVFSVSMEHGVVNQIELLGRSFAAADTSHYTIGRRFDVVYTKSPLKAFPFGIVKQCKFDGEVALSPLYGVFTPSNQYLGLMIEAYFESPNRSIDFLSPLCQKGAKNTLQITNAKFLSGRLPLPRQEAEQQKVGDFLSSMDELITAQARKVDALKTHKKGLVRQLFPRDCETQPRFRFPEFQNTEDWIQKFVGDVSEVLMCKRIFAEETNPIGGVPFYKIGTLGGTPDAFISKEQFEAYKSKYNFPRIGEVLITCSGTIGKCLAFDGKDAYFQDSNIVWLDNPKREVSNEFLLMLLSNVNWGKLNSTTITRIYGPDLRGLAIKFPQNSKEQQRIADCILSLDALITAETKKLEALKTQKNGLMQQLFPSVEEKNEP